MLALFDPYKEGIKSYRGYNIEELDGKYRACQVLKNRFGECDVEVGLNFFGEINYFCELPKSSEIQDYSKYTSPNYLLSSDE